MAIEGTSEVQLLAGVESAFEPPDAPRRKGTFRRLMRRPGPFVATIYLGILILCAIFAPIVTNDDPTDIDAANALSPPSWQHLLGTDHLGRDFWSRIVYGAR